MKKYREVKRNRDKLDILKNILSNKKERTSLIKSFQERVWNGEEFNSDERINEILRDLALDLDYYEPDKILRSESPSYYGDKRLESEVTDVIFRINKTQTQNVK